jgi:hypothetical protein
MLSTILLQYLELAIMAENTEHQQARPFKFTVTHYRKTGTTHDAFMKWIVEVHLPKAIPIFKKYGVVGYALVSSLPD